MGRTEEALARGQESFKILRLWAEKQPGNNAHQGADALCQVAMLQIILGRYQEALTTAKQVADMSKNSTPSTPKGDRHDFDATEARYIRVNMLYHSLNRGVHIVEVRALAAEEER